MHLDPALPTLVAVSLAILLIGLALRALRQPHVVGYLIAGVVLGPGVLGVVTDPDLIGRIGALGVVLLMFFIGMEVSPRRLAANWRVAVLGTLLQILVSVGCAWSVGTLFEWPVSRSVLVGFVISMSSTAVVLKLLQDWQEIDTDVGQDVVGILLVQDMAIVPMLIVIGMLGGADSTAPSAVLQMLGAVLVFALVGYLVRVDRIHLPFARALRLDHELQVFSALVVALGLALLTGLLGLSTALGAFVGGMLVASAKETAWVHRSLEPFRVVFVALFFVSVGMLIETEFVVRYWRLLLVLIAAVFATNTFVNVLTLRMFGSPWRETLHGGALLAPIGEFSFLLAAVGLQTGIINDFSYDLTVSVIAISLLISPAWIALVSRLTGRAAPAAARSSARPS